MCTFLADDGESYDIELKIKGKRLIAIWDGEEAEIKLTNIVLIEEKLKSDGQKTPKCF